MASYTGPRSDGLRGPRARRNGRSSVKMLRERTQQFPTNYEPWARLASALHKLGRNVEYLLAPDEGHGFAGRENRLAMYAAIERFLAAQLQGRYQAEMPEDIAKRLAAITVDVRHVKATPAVVGGRTPN